MRDSFLERFELFAATATVAAHANSLNRGFRQRDVKFLIELFSNWVESSIGEVALAVQNTQVQRYLDQIIAAGYGKRSKSGRVPSYRLTRAGLIELISRVVAKDFFEVREHFFFLFYFLKNYRRQFEELVKSDGQRFPIALQLELEDLLDVNALVKRQLQTIDKEIKKLEVRIEEQGLIARDLAQARKAGVSFNDAVKEIELRYPYGLNSQKPFQELLSEIPHELGDWELRFGTLFRRDELWLPSLALLRSYRCEVEKLSINDR